MNLIDRITSEAELTSVRDHFRQVMAQRMSLPLKPGNANELVADLLGAEDWNTALGMIRAREQAQLPTMPCHCKKCGTKLDSMGYCIDRTCQYNDCPQTMDLNEINNWYDLPNTVRLERCDQFYRVRVDAEVHSDDQRIIVAFDAAPYFIWADENGTLAQVIRDLANCDWGGDCPADAVAQHFENGPVGYAEVKRMFYHIQNLPNTKFFKDLRGFECNVEPTSLFKWLNRYHRAVLLEVMDDCFPDLAENVDRYYPAIPR